MYESLQALKSPPSSQKVRAQLNANRDEILANTFTRGLPEAARFTVSPEFKQDLAIGWDHGTMTSADAFFHYYSHFTRDQDELEANLSRLKTPVRVVWGEQDLYIKKEMGMEFAAKAGVPIDILPGMGHFPHLQSPRHVVAAIDASFGR
jgi:pimeloyl-ACP methyl ester carboxylesterase